MNTGIPSITSSPAGSTLPKASAAPAKADASAEAKPASSTVPLPANSNSPVGISESDGDRGTPPQEQHKKPTLQEVIQLSEKLNESVQKIQRDLNFSVDDSLGEIVVKVIDRSTKEVIRSIPSEEMLNLSRNIEEVNSLLFDKIKA